MSAAGSTQGRAEGAAPRVAGVILNWNGLAVTRRCIASVRAQSLPIDTLVVVDNGSTDGSCEALEAEFGDTLDLVRNAENLGFAGGINAGLSRLLAQERHDFVFILNNDARLDPQAVQAACQAGMADPRAAAVTGVISFDAPGRPVWFAGGSEQRYKLVASHRHVAPAARCEQPFLSGCFLVFRVEALRQVGLFDERFFAYCEDYDWCLRARAQGWRLLLEPGATLVHEVGHSSGSGGRGGWFSASPLTFYLMIRNQFYLVAKHLAGARRCVATAYWLGAAAAVFAIALARGRWGHARTTVNALGDGLRFPAAARHQAAIVRAHRRG